jgi:hypothetical protein
MPTRPKRMDVGFAGGQVLGVRTSAEQYEELARALQSEGKSRWHKLKTEDSEVMVDLPQVVYVQYEGDEHKVGF